MRLLLFGKNGQPGRHSLPSLGPILALDKDDLDLADSDALGKFMVDSAPNVVINASAYTAIDQAGPAFSADANTKPCGVL